MELEGGRLSTGPRQDGLQIGTRNTSDLYSGGEKYSVGGTDKRVRLLTPLTSADSRPMKTMIAPARDRYLMLRMIQEEGVSSLGLTTAALTVRRSMATMSRHTVLRST